MASNVPSFSHLREARSSFKNIGIILPQTIPSGSSLCIVGYKGKDDVTVRYLIGSPKEKFTFLTMNLTLASGKEFINYVKFLKLLHSL